MGKLESGGRFTRVASMAALGAICLAFAGCNTVANRADVKRDVAAIPPYGAQTAEAEPAEPKRAAAPKRQATAAPNLLDKKLSYAAIGMASWYGPGFHGRRTANGEIYNMHSLTAAHRSLPLPSTVRVTNLANNRSLTLRVNDRGPFAGNRLIDLSAQSAKLLGFYDRGLAKVKVELVGGTPPRPAPQVTASAASP